MDALGLRVLFRVADFAASVLFYEERLGMERLAAWESPDGPGIVLAAGNGQTIELFGPAPGASHDELVARGVELMLQVEDVAAWHARMGSVGVPIKRELLENPWGTRSFGIDDPDGVRIWLSQVLQPE